MSCSSVSSGSTVGSCLTKIVVLIMIDWLLFEITYPVGFGSIVRMSYIGSSFNSVVSEIELVSKVLPSGSVTEQDDLSVTKERWIVFWMCGFFYWALKVVHCVGNDRAR